MDGRKNPARGLCCLLTRSTAVPGMWEAEVRGFPPHFWAGYRCSGAVVASRSISMSPVRRAAPRGAIAERAPGAAVRLLGGPTCHLWHKGDPGGPCRPAPRAGSTAVCQLAQPACLPLGQRRLQPVSFPGSLGACPSGHSSPRCRALGTASGIRVAVGARASPAGPRRGGHLLPLLIPTSKPSPVPPTSTTPHLWQLQDAVKHFST